MPTLKVNFYGEGYAVHLLENHVFYKEIANKMKRTVPEAVLDIQFFYHLKNDKYQCLQDCYVHTFSGLLNNAKGKIEIWFGRKKIAKISIANLCDTLTLFPLYTIINDVFIKEQIQAEWYVAEQEIGLIGSYKLEIEQFNIEHLQFYMAQQKKQKIVHQLRYNNIVMPLVKKDTLLQRQWVYTK